MIANFCDDILIKIHQYLTNKEGKHFSQTCKALNRVGYLKKISMNFETDPFNFTQVFRKHNYTLEQVLIYRNMYNPHNFMPGKWSKQVYIYYSMLTTPLNPQNADKTETLKIYSLYEKCKQIKINWKKFKNLKNLYLYCEDIDLDGIEECTELSNIFIYLIKKKTLSNKLGSFKNLNSFITNCDLENNTEFISPYLNIFVSRNMDYANFKFNKNLNIVKKRNKFPYLEETIYKLYVGI
jgi:hypothetical protein